LSGELNGTTNLKSLTITKGNFTVNSSISSELFKPHLRKSTKRPAQAQQLCVSVESDPSLWGICIEDYGSHRPLIAEFGALPGEFNFNPDTARLFALAQAARRIASDYPNAVVVNVALTCEERGKGKAAA
jgi:hypothetical protein